MKKNGNDARLGNYYVGLDVGTNSVGWAVTDENYCLKKCKGNGMWGVRLFDDAQKAEQRRTSRVARRRLARKKQRLMLLEILFAKEIAKVDPDFYLRMQESALRKEDTSKGDKFSLFQDAAFTDREYHLRYPTAYHLRKELLESEEPHDVRLVYLAVHHIVKNRGHFLLDTMDDADGDVTLENALNDLAAFLQEEYELEFLPSDRPGFLAAMENRDLGVTAKKKAIKTAHGKAESSEELNLSAFLELLAGGSVKLASLFQDDALKDGEISSISLKNMENDAEQCSEILGDRFALVAKAKNLFDAAQLSQILNGKTYLSEAKVAQYEENKRDLKLLKAYVKKCIPEKYKLIFSVKNVKTDNYAAYSGYRLRSGDYACSQEAFCKFLLGKEIGLPEPAPEDAAMGAVYRKIKEGTFLPRLRSSENGVIPYQLNKRCRCYNDV